jgi:very-short-patch-repair endonuclease
MNYVICGYRVDVIFLPDLLIVELDGWRVHGTPPSFEADRDQDAAILEQTGIPTIRVTYKQFHADPAKQAGRIHAVLARRRARHAA